VRRSVVTVGLVEVEAGAGVPSRGRASGGRRGRAPRLGFSRAKEGVSSSALNSVSTRRSPWASGGKGWAVVPWSHSGSQPKTSTKQPGQGLADQPLGSLDGIAVAGLLGGEAAEGAEPVEFALGEGIGAEPGVYERGRGHHDAVGLKQADPRPMKRGWILGRWSGHGSEIPLFSGTWAATRPGSGRRFRAARSACAARRTRLAPRAAL
jgi:hypothetical protein